ncbi:MAG TPA: hypothetical protein VHC49_10340 [Mycobacteriales bacterium]|nr:hypothetical protein [Mycobacteriales bacterium]
MSSRYGRSLLEEMRQRETGGVLEALTGWWARLPAVLGLNAVLVGGLVGWWILARIAALPGYALGAAGFAGSWSAVSAALVAVLEGTGWWAALRQGWSARSLVLALPWLVAVLDLRFAAGGGSFGVLGVSAVVVLCTWLTQVCFLLEGSGGPVPTWRAALVQTGLRPVPALGLITLGALVALVIAAWSALAIIWLPGLWLALAVAVLREQQPFSRAGVAR